MKLAGKVSQAKSQEDSAAAGDFTDAENGDYLLADHIERLRYLEVKPSEEELPLVSAVLEKTLPGLEQFVTEERHATLIGKMMYNAMGVGSRTDKVCQFGSVSRSLIDTHPHLRFFLS